MQIETVSDSISFLAEPSVFVPIWTAEVGRGIVADRVNPWLVKDDVGAGVVTYGGFESKSSSPQVAAVGRRIASSCRVSSSSPSFLMGCRINFTVYPVGSRGT